MNTDKQQIISNMLSQLTDSAEHNQKVYSEVAKHYDDGQAAVGNVASNVMAKGIVKIYRENKIQTEELHALDVACGAGRCGLALRDFGFLGTIDGLDGCKEMLDVAETKNVYRTLYHEMISVESPLPMENSSYDLITCFGSLSFGHVPHECLEKLLDILVPGGIMVLTYSEYRNLGSSVQYKKSVEQRMEMFKSKYELLKTDESYFPTADLNKINGIVTIVYLRKI